MKQSKITPVLPESPSVKVIGLGGVGAIIARYGSLFLSSPSLNESARVVLIDGDDYEPRNAVRMLFKANGNKAEVMRDELLEYMSDSRVSLLAIPEYVTPENINNLIFEDDIIFLAVDNHKTRKMVNDHVSKLDNITLISAGNDPEGEDNSGKFLRGSYGNCQVYLRRNGKDLTNSLTKWHNEIEDPKDELPTEMSCGDMLAHVPQVLFANMQAAACALQAFYRILCSNNLEDSIRHGDKMAMKKDSDYAGPPIYGEVLFDFVDGTMTAMPYPGPKTKEEELISTEATTDIVDEADVTEKAS